MPSPCATRVVWCARQRPMLGRFFLRETAKEPQLDDSALTRVKGTEAIQCFIKHQDFSRALRREQKVDIEADLLVRTGPLISSISAAILHQDAAHDLGRHPKKVRAILPVLTPLIGQMHECFIDQSWG